MVTQIIINKEKIQIRNNYVIAVNYNKIWKI